ncbi:MAG: orotidine 5'-phosphate decarboxylase [Ignavibacteria bacterium GWB2_35_12]|nr:MAG: orotidine 5'-phosphate decarboxylase [Ignavibacteria bacterium GWA2_35_8]OGU42430.1 MAG: orotidine 5'-phosphate decarboxylase [Ignavibacteria bacterium GWB2_35_12]OGU96599.1 MAG: orotidine 5'-phosphate decarboxylase [Ignavibacteria bacterium RIFOXYA2_FULL_35_10]OGV24210.1 MAG: orotidine 5'-phosphate decarboxylase [Ignavibacteria bacterium RIFOXYC2_FULL_35_21]
MDTFEKLKRSQAKNSSILCVGLDVDLNKVPQQFKSVPDGLFEFNKSIIHATKDFVCAYKLNFAFYEQYGIEGYELLKKTFELIPENIVSIADAKRCDIGNTMTGYAKSIFDYFNADAVTINPYLGKDSLDPFFSYKKKMVFLLTLTSNPGSANFQRLESGGIPLYKHIIKQSLSWADKTNLAYVIGATQPDDIDKLRALAPNNFFLIPGIGAQGGSVEAVVKANANGPAIINVSRAVIYASKEKDFAEKAREKAIKYKLSFM